MGVELAGQGTGRWIGGETEGGREGGKEGWMEGGLRLPFLPSLISHHTLLEVAPVRGEAVKCNQRPAPCFQFALEDIASDVQQNALGLLQPPLFTMIKEYNHFLTNIRNIE